MVHQDPAHCVASIGGSLPQRSVACIDWFQVAHHLGHFLQNRDQQGDAVGHCESGNLFEILELVEQTVLEMRTSPLLAVVVVYDACYSHAVEGFSAYALFVFAPCPVARLSSERFSIANCLDNTIQTR